MPTQPLESPIWPHPSRLPLGNAWGGKCTSPLCSNAGSTLAPLEPAEQELNDGCNLGYAKNCSWLPAERHADAVRFGIACDRDNRIAVRYVCELGYRPGEHGVLEYEVVSGAWRSRHPDARIQRMAECYLESYLGRRRRT
jgi:hypothetical protein